MQELNLCTTRCEPCDRDLELIFMLWPGPRTPLLPVAPKEPVSQGAEGTTWSLMTEKIEKLRLMKAEAER